jgi:hypothetical protein
MGQQEVFEVRVTHWFLRATRFNDPQAAPIPASYGDLQELLERFPDWVIEFATYSCEVGCIARRNTVFWEIRNY